MTTYQRVGSRETECGKLGSYPSMDMSPKTAFHDPPAAPKPRTNGAGKFLAVAGGAVAVGLGSSYLTVLTATPSRSEVRELIREGIAAVKDTATLDRETLISWRESNAVELRGLRSDVQRLAEQQAGTNRLLEMLVKERTPPK